MTTAPSTWRFQYTGQTAIPQIGLYYYKARFYNPALGRFMQVDPIGYDDDNNLYAYVGNDPLNKSDPTGKCESASTCRDDRDIRNNASGKLSNQQLHENQAARAAGVAVGGIIVTAALAAAAATPVIAEGLTDIGVGAELAAESSATRTVASAASNAGKEIAKAAGDQGKAVLVTGVMALADDAYISYAVTTGVEGAEVVSAIAEAGGAEFGAKQSVDLGLSAWQHMLKIVDGLF